MLLYLAHHGPLTVVVNALGWKYYLNGIIYQNCEATVQNHVAQIVGYDLT